MAQREGAVYLYLFIGTFVLFVAMVVMFFVWDSKVSELKAAAVKQNTEIEAAKKTATSYAGEVQSLKQLVMGAEARETATTQVIDSCNLKRDDAQDFLNKKFQELENRSPKAYTQMLDPYDDYKDIVGKILDAKKTFEEKMKRAEEELLAIKKQTKEEVQKKDEALVTVKTQLDDTQKSYEGRITQLTRDGERVAKELASARDEFASKEIVWKRSEATYKNQISSLQTRLDTLTEEQRKTKGIDDVDPDGQILDVATASQIGWVDIGRKQHLRPGIDFQVYQVVKGGKRQLKGRVEVQQVDETTSRFRITQTVDDLNPIAKGDYITSPFFDPKINPTFVIAGKGLESKKVTEEVLRAKIKSYGATIKEDVGNDTTFLIVIKDYDKDEASQAIYRKARELRVPIIREPEILEYMGF